MAETLNLPDGWTVEEAPSGFDPARYSSQQKGFEEAKALGLPEGWTVEDASDVKRLDNESELREQAGEFAAPEKTAQDLKNMTLEEKLAFIEDINRERAYLHGPKHLQELAKGALSGATFGLTENIEALQPDKSGLYSGSNVAGQVAGSLLPLHGLTKVFSGPAAKLAEQSPVFQNQLTSLATMFGVGATEAGLRTVAKGEIPSADDMVKHGAEWAAIDAAFGALGMTGRFAKELLAKAKDTGASRLNILNDIAEQLGTAGIDLTNAEAVGTKAMEVLKNYGQKAKEPIVRGIKASEKTVAKETVAAKETLEKTKITPNELKTGNIKQEPVQRLTDKKLEVAEPYAPEAVNFTKESAALESGAVTELIEGVGKKARSKGDLGNIVKRDIEDSLASQKSEYGPLYNEVEGAAKDLYHSPQRTATEARVKLLDMLKLKTKPGGYASVEKSLENILEDTGYVLMRDESGNISNVIQKGEVSVKQTMNLGKRINEIIDFEAVEPSVKDALKSVVRAAKSDVKKALGEQAPDVLAAYELAEEAHGKLAAKFRNKTVRRIRQTDDADKIARMVETPNGFAKAKDVLTPETFKMVERELLDEMNSKSYEQSKKMFREFEKHMTEDTRMLARDITEAKNPHNPDARNRLVQQGVLEDVSNALNTGQRPSKTLDLWKTRKGQKLVEKAFKDSPNWKSVKKYLEEQSFSDMVSSVTKDGKLDIKKFESFMSNPAAIEDIRALGGEQAVEFFQNMGANVKRLKSNKRLLQKIPKIEKRYTYKKSQNVRGQSLLERAAKKISQEKKSLPEKIGHIKEQPSGRGKEILEKTKRKVEARKEDLKIRQEHQKTREAAEEAKKTPLANKVNSWFSIAEDVWGLKPKAALTLLGFSGFGLKGAFVAGVSIKLMDKLLTSPRLRKAFVEASKGYSAPVPFVLALDEFVQVIQDEL